MKSTQPNYTTRNECFSSGKEYLKHLKNEGENQVKKNPKEG